MSKNKAQIFHFDLYGKREEKYDFLNENSLASVDWTALQPEAPNFFFVNKNMQGKEEYEKGFKVDELLVINTSGIKTHNDGNLVSFIPFTENNQRYSYRPFDVRFINYDLQKVQRHRFSVMKHMLQQNISLNTCRQQSTFDFQHIFISKCLVDMCEVSLQTKETTYSFPLYLYPESSGLQTIEQTTERIPNLNMEIVEKIANKLGLVFTQEKENGTSTGSASVSYSPIDILDYIYAVLHSPTYREQYKEFLKIDFPRVPYPKDADTFWQLVKLGGEIRQIHLLESPVVDNYITQYPIDGDNVVSKTKYENGKVYINETQYFDHVPQVAWEFYIGGYQPAQKWLKDRKGRALDFEDILHYQKTIVALTETDRLMKEVDKIDI